MPPSDKPRLTSINPLAAFSARLRSIPPDGHEPRDVLSATRNDNFLAPLYAIEECTQCIFSLKGADFAHGSNPVIKLDGKLAYSSLTNPESKILPTIAITALSIVDMYVSHAIHVLYYSTHG